MGNRAANAAIVGFAHGHVGGYCEEWKRHPEYGLRVVAGWDHDLARLEQAAAHERDRGDRIAA